MYGIYEDIQQGLFMVMELMEEGSLDKLLKIKRDQLDLSSLISFSIQTASGMTYLSEKSIIHRDLAARNLLVQSVNSKYVIKIADFGLSRTASTGYYRLTKESNFAVKWSAPEIFKGKKITSQSDVWSFGVVLFEIFSYGEEPYQGIPNEEVSKNIMKGIRLTPPSICPEKVKKIMKDCWELDPIKRPTFQVKINFQ